MAITIKHATQIAAFNGSWDDFFSQPHHLQLRHLQAFEQAQIPDIENHYLQIFFKGKLAGLAYLQLFKLKHTYLNYSASQTVQSKLIKFFFPEKLQLLICGNLFRINFQGFYFKNEQHNGFIFDAIDLFIKQNPGS